jgi:hypothetical protein
VAINPALILNPAGQPGVMTPQQDALNGAYTGNYSGTDPNAGQIGTRDFTSVGLPWLGAGPQIAAPGQVSAPAVGFGAPSQIFGTPTNLGPASAIQGQATAGDSGVASSATNVGLVFSGDPAAYNSSDPGLGSLPSGGDPAATPAAIAPPPA